MPQVPESLERALAPVTIVAGHYGVGKTNFAINLAVDLQESGKRVTLVDLDIVNPYFRASEQRAFLEEKGVRLVAPVFAERGTSLDVPSLTGLIVPAIAAATVEGPLVIDVGGDDAGSTALGRFAAGIATRPYAFLLVANRYRNLVQEPADALENLREIEEAARLEATAIVSNAHLKQETTVEHIARGWEYAQALAQSAGLPCVCATVPANLYEQACNSRAALPDARLLYSVLMYVTSPWEEDGREANGENRSR